MGQVPFKGITSRTRNPGSLPSRWLVRSDAGLADHPPMALCLVEKHAPASWIKGGNLKKQDSSVSFSKD